MSDHPNPNLHRGDGVSGRSVLVALLVILGIVALLVLASTFGGSSSDRTPASDAITPAAESAPVAAD